MNARDFAPGATPFCGPGWTNWTETLGPSLNLERLWSLNSGASAYPRAPASSIRSRRMAS